MKVKPIPSPPSFIPTRLNRYTTLPFLLEILTRRQLTLLSPYSWEDQNDAHYLRSYGDKRELKTLLALCFTMHRETFHHWKIYSNGPSGVCIEFDPEKLLPSFPTGGGFLLQKVRYSFVKEVKGKKPAPFRWPFLKRICFEDEREFRIIFESKTQELHTKAVPIPLSSIQKITLGPWLPKGVAETIIDVIHGIPGCTDLHVNRSLLLEHTSWRAAIA
jgi:hypothetical protein